MYPSTPGYPPYPPAAPPQQAWGPPPTYPPAFPPQAPMGSTRRVANEGGRRAMLVVAVVLAVLAGGFAVVNLSAGAESGATTPEGAVEKFFDSIGDEDLIGVLEVLDPGERDVLVPFVRRLASELDRLGLTDGVNPEDVGGIDLEVDGLEVVAQELGPGVSEVTITDGVISFATEPDAVPVGDVLRDIVEANGGEIDIPQQQDQSPLAEDDGVFLVTTESGGRWHLSLGFTIAEYARRDAGYDLPDLSGGVAPQGAASPEEAVRELVDAATALDVERMISLLPPDEMHALQVYAPLFLEDMQDDADQFRYEEDFDVTVDSLELSTTEIEGGTRVIPTAGSMTLQGQDGESTIAYADGCIEVSGVAAGDFVDDFGDSRVCTDDFQPSGSGLSDQDQADLEALGALFEGFEPGVTVVERDGAFYVDPLRTVGDLGFQVFAGIEREDLEEGGILYRLFTGDMFDSGFGYSDYSDFTGDECDVWDPETGDC